MIVAWIVKMMLMVIVLTGASVVLGAYFAERDRGRPAGLYLAAALVLFGFFVILGAL
jgi:hypothetical protein